MYSGSSALAGSALAISPTSTHAAATAIVRTPRIATTGQSALVRRHPWPARAVLLSTDRTRYQGMRRIETDERRDRLGRRHCLAPGATAADPLDAATAVVALHATDPS